MKTAQTFILLASAFLCSGHLQHARSQQAVPAQSPSQTPARTGRSYDTAAPARRPPAQSVPQQPSPVLFADATAHSGINFQHAASATSRKYLPETMGGGVAMFDYDNDGRLDLYFTNGARLDDPMPKGAMPDKSDARFRNRLYRQKADGAFEDVTERAGVRGEGYSMGAAAGDYDGDGFTDLYVTAYGGAVLYRNKGDGTFEDVTRRTGTIASGWPTSAGWFDFDRDGLLDLFVARYMEWDFERGGSLLCGDPRYRAYCHPDNFKGATAVLYRQKADHTFEDVSVRAKIDEPGKGLGVAFADFDNDGLIDVFLANDSIRQFLYRNRGDGTFEDIAMLAGTGYDENGKTFAGMGVDAADFDNDGYMDVFVTALSNETYPLFRNNGDETFTYVTSATGIGQISLLYSGWGTRFADFDNDGLRDIFVAQGHVLDTIETTTTYLTYKQPSLLMRNTGKGFVNVTASAGQVLNVPLTARGAAFGDLDNDGDTDIVLAQTGGPAVIMRNEGTKNRWLGISLAGARGNRDGLGARITVTDATGGKQIFDVTRAGSYLSSNDARIIAGLGAKTGVRTIEVRWPNGRTQTVSNPPLDKYTTINEK